MPEPVKIEQETLIKKEETQKTKNDDNATNNSYIAVPFGNDGNKSI